MDKSEADRERITWIASYPKSGNTWVRTLLQAYRCNGYLELNDLHTGIGDSSECYTRAVCPIPLKDLGMQGQLMLRPAALLNALSGKQVPRFFKTHFADLSPVGVPAFIPAEFTQRAIYIVRDPRDVLISFCNFYSLSLRRGVEAMAKRDFWIGGSGQAYQVLSSWSNHVASWGSETRFPVHVAKYEDLINSPESELAEILQFIGWEVDEDRVRRSVEACASDKLQQQEQDKGFVENTMAKERGNFFNGGGSRWRDELGQKWVDAIERDHGDTMKLFGYLPSNVTDIAGNKDIAVGS